MNLAFRDEVPPVPTSNKPKFGMSPKLLLLAGAGLLVVIISFVLLAVSSSSNISPQLQHLSARLGSLQELVDVSKDSITNPDLNKLNSDLSILVTGSIARLETPLKNAGMGSISEDVKKSEADALTVQNLEDAKLTGVFDRSYVRIMTNKLDSTLALMNTIYAKTSSTTLKTALKASYDDLLLVKNQLTEINV